MIIYDTRYINSVHTYIHTYIHVHVHVHVHACLYLSTCWVQHASDGILLGLVQLWSFQLIQAPLESRGVAHGVLRAIGERKDGVQVEMIDGKVHGSHLNATVGYESNGAVILASSTGACASVCVRVWWVYLDTMTKVYITLCLLHCGLE